MVATAALNGRGAHAGEAQPALEAKILLRALAYDEALLERVGGEVTIAVVSARLAPASLLEQREMVDAFSAFSGATIRKLPVRIVPLRYLGADELARQLTAEKAAAVYVPEAMGEVAEAIAAVARGLQVVAMTRGFRNSNAGIALAVAYDGGKPQLVVNLGAGRSSGMRLSADLLSVARVVP